MRIKVLVIFCILLSNIYANESYIKAMAKNRSSKNIKGSNYKIINSTRQYNKLVSRGVVIGNNATNIKRGLIFNYVKVTNVGTKKMSKRKIYNTNKYTQNTTKKRLYGVKVKKDFKGNIYNAVKIKNSHLN